MTNPLGPTDPEGALWTPGVCFECGGGTPDQGTSKHPPLCSTCVLIWYPHPPPEDDLDCRSVAK